MTTESGELTPITPKPVKAKVKRLAKGKRTHIRRLKAEARKEGTVYRPVI